MTVARTEEYSTYPLQGKTMAWLSMGSGCRCSCLAAVPGRFCIACFEGREIFSYDGNYYEGY